MNKIRFWAQAAILSGLLLILLGINMMDGARWPIVSLH